MSRPISQRELRNDNAAVIRRVLAGESFVVTRRGVPVADLVPHRGGGRSSRSAFVAAEEIEESFRDLPQWGAESHAEERAAFDRLVDDADRDPWA